MLLQTAIDTVNNSTSATNNFSLFGFTLLQIEKVIIFGIIALQLFRTFRISTNIFELSNIFNFPLEVKNGFIEKELLNSNEATIDDIIFDEEDNSFANEIENDDNIKKITIVKSLSNNPIMNRIEESINTYLLNNYGANVNFSIIKDMIDREVEAKDEEINQSIPTPLYLGLAATMFGIIFGLASMPNIEGDNFITAINILINGVKWAMVASVSGLLLTTILSSFVYKKAKSKILLNKNQQLSLLQAELLPELNKAEDSGVSGLKQSLDLFSRKATKIVDNVNIAALNTGQNIKDQLRVLEKVDQLKVTRVTKASVELFDRLDNNMIAFNKFSKNVSIIAEISENLKQFANRTGAIDTVANQIGTSLEESQKLSRFLSEHFDKIEESGNQAISAVNYSDAHFRDAIEKLTEETDNRISKINKNANDHETKLQDTYDEIGKKLNTITSQHLNEFRSAYADVVPKFEKLNHLEILKPIKESIDHSFSDSKNDSYDLINQVNNIKDLLNKESNNRQDNQNLEKAISDLSVAITGKELVVGEENKKSDIFKNIELSLRIIGWTVIITIGTYTILTHFNWI